MSLPVFHKKLLDAGLSPSGEEYKNLSVDYAGAIYNYRMHYRKHSIVKQRKRAMELLSMLSNKSKEIDFNIKKSLLISVKLHYKG